MSQEQGLGASSQSEDRATRQSPSLVSQSRPFGECPFAQEAAPDLFRALNDLLELVSAYGLESCGDVPMHEFDAIVDGAIHDARKALAKARGQ